MISDHINPELKLDSIKSELNSFLISLNITQFTWTSQIRDKIPELAAYVFAIYAIQTAKHFFEHQDNEDKKIYLITSHSTQVVAIFRILGIGDADIGEPQSNDLNDLMSNLVQVLTGEGKSLVLAGAACILALLGGNVNVACYNNYLVERDQKKFIDLFYALDIKNNIKYDTFNKLCENMMNEEGNIRLKIESLVLSDPSQNQNICIQKLQTKIRRPNFLLIDEFDTVFKPEFLRNDYNCSCNINHVYITKLIKYIWNQRASFSLQELPKAEIFLQDLKNTNEFKLCCEVFKDFSFLVENFCKFVKIWFLRLEHTLALNILMNI